MGRGMKTVIVFRHAKAEWGAPDEADHDRPLSGRGRSDASRMGRFLSRAGPVPERIISSSAKRARTTLKEAMDAGEWASPVEVTREFYGASPQSVLLRLQAVDEEVDSILLVGHEPTWSELAGALSGGASIKIQTAAMARIDFPVASWTELDFGRGTLIWLIGPRLVKLASN